MNDTTADSSSSSSSSSDTRTAKQATMLANRLRKNARKLKSWRKKHNVQAYRAYDRDIPEVAVCVDRYGDWAQLTEYLRGDEPKSSHWLNRMRAAVAEGLDIELAQVVVKQRERQRGAAQYEKLQSSRKPRRFEVCEGDLRFWIDLHSYLDTGLFLDHRPLRRRVAAEAAGKRVLNLFCYTGSFTVHAAAAGARSTTSVDLSNTYLQWTDDNLELNGLQHPRHELIPADVDRFLQERRGQRQFDLAILDPPTFSNSKKTSHTLDIQRDHVRLCLATAAVLKPGGTLYFSTNLRTFKLDIGKLADLLPRDITAKTIPPDFRNKRIHQVWQLTAPGY